MESKIKIEYDPIKIANKKNENTPKWVIGSSPENNKDIPSTNVVYADCMADSLDITGDGGTKKTPTVTIEKAKEKAAAENKNIVVSNLGGGTFPFYGTIDLKEKSIFFADGVKKIERTKQIEASKSFSVSDAYTFHFATRRNVTNHGVFRAEINVKKVDFHYRETFYELNIYLNEDLVFSKNIGSEIEYDGDKEYPGLFELDATDVVDLHWNGIDLYIFIFRNKSHEYGPPVRRNFQRTIYYATFNFNQKKTNSFEKLPIPYGNIGIINQKFYEKSSKQYTGKEIVLAIDNSSGLKFVIHAEDKIGDGRYFGNYLAISKNFTYRYKLYSYREKNSPQSYPQEQCLLSAIYKNGIPFWPLPCLAISGEVKYKRDDFRGVIMFSQFWGCVVDASQSDHGFSLEFGELLEHYEKKIECYYNYRENFDSSWKINSKDFWGNYNNFRMNNITLTHENPSVNTLETFPGKTLGLGYPYAIAYTPISLYNSCEADSEACFFNGVVNNLEAGKNLSIVSEGAAQNCTSIQGNGKNDKRNYAICSNGDISKCIMSGGRLGHYSREFRATENSLILNCEVATEDTTISHCTIHKCVYATASSTEISNSIIAFCTGQYLSKNSAPLKITRSVIRESLNQNLVPVGSTLDKVKIADPFFKSAKQPFDLHLRSTLNNYAVSSPAIGLTSSPSIHGQNIMREAGAYDDFYSASEIWENIIIEAPWKIDLPTSREFLSNKLADGRHSIGAHSLPTIKITLSWLPLTSEPIKLIQNLLWAKSQKIRVYFNPTLKPEFYLEGYLEPRMNFRPPIAPLTGIADKVSFVFRAKLPDGDVQKYL